MMIVGLHMQCGHYIEYWGVTPPISLPCLKCEPAKYNRGHDSVYPVMEVMRATDEQEALWRW